VRKLSLQRLSVCSAQACYADTVALLCVCRDACYVSARAAGATELQAPKLGRIKKSGDRQET